MAPHSSIWPSGERAGWQLLLQGRQQGGGGHGQGVNQWLGQADTTLLGWSVATGTARPPAPHWRLQPARNVESPLSPALTLMVLMTEEQKKPPGAGGCPIAQAKHVGGHRAAQHSAARVGRRSLQVVGGSGVRNEGHTAAAPAPSSPSARTSVPYLQLAPAHI